MSLDTPPLQDVNFDKNVLYCSLKDLERGVGVQHASDNRRRARKEITAAMNRNGTLSHQATAIHDIITVGERDTNWRSFGSGKRPTAELGGGKGDNPKRNRNTMLGGGEG